MKTIYLIFLSALVGTTLMTLFNYLVNRTTAQNFRVPELLNKLISGSRLIPYAVGNKNPAGWIVHYAIGIVFALAFYLAYRITPLYPSIFSATLLGFVAGVAGTLGWKVLFAMNDHPPEIDLRKFFLQLVVAHIVFGLGVVLFYVPV